MADGRPFPRSDEQDIQNLRDYAGSFDLPRQPGLTDYPIYGASQAARALTPHSQAAGWSYAPRGYGLGDILPGQAGRYAEQAEDRVRQAHPETAGEIEQQGAEFSAGIPFFPSTGVLARAGVASGVAPAAVRDVARLKGSPLFGLFRSAETIPGTPGAIGKAHPAAVANMERRGIQPSAELQYLQRQGLIERGERGWRLTDAGRSVHGQPRVGGPEDAARTMRLTGADNAAIHRETGLAFTPAGELVRETSDAAARLHLNRLRPGETLPMSDVLEHPELYARRPDLARAPVTGTEREWSVGRGSVPITEDGGRYAVPLSDTSPAAQEAIRAQMLKRVQQSEPGLSLAGRHAPGTNTAALSGTLARVEALAAKNPDDVALAAYRDMLRGQADDVGQVLSGELTPLVRGLLRREGAPRTGAVPEAVREKLAESLLYDRMPGGRVADLVRARAADPAAAAAAPMPFAQQVYQLPGGRRWGQNAGYPQGASARLAPIPPASMSDAQLLDFARNWKTFGGRP